MLQRRSFVGALIGASVAPSLVGQPKAATQESSPKPARSSAEEWDLSFLDRLTGKHKQVFDFSNLEVGLLVVKNWFDAHQNVFGLTHPDVNAVVGIGGHAFPVNARDELYRKYPIGELWKVNDPETGAPAQRNIFLDGAKTGSFVGAGVRPLQARGAVFWMCNNALHGVAQRIAAAVHGSEAELYPELRAGLNPGVIVVPAHTMLIGLCQERGCAYESL